MVIAPIRWSGEVFVHFAAKTRHTCLTVRSVLSVLWLDSVWVFKSSQGQSLHHDLYLDSIENGSPGFRLRFTTSRPLISRPLG